MRPNISQDDVKKADINRIKGASVEVDETTFPDKDIMQKLLSYFKKAS